MPLVWLDCDVPVEEAAAREPFAESERGDGRRVVRFTAADIAAGNPADRLG